MVINLSDEKNLEIKVKIHLKKMPRAEYEAIMIPYKRLMLQFERTLRQLADNGVISFSIVDKFTKEFNFAEIQRLRFSQPEEMDPYQQARPAQQTPPAQVPQYQQPAQQPFAYNQQPATSRGFQQPQQPITPTFSANQQNPTAQRPSGFSFGQNTPQTPAPSSQGFEKQESSPFGSSSSPRPGSTPPATSFQRQESQSGMFGQGGGNLGSFSDLSKDSSMPQPSFAPKQAPPTQPSFSLSNDFSSQSKPQEGKISVGIDEEDRATGIAILRKKMLMELRKIRNVVEQEDDSSF